MSEFNVACPGCGKELVADTQWIGMEADCPECGRKFVISQPRSTPPRIAGNFNVRKAETFSNYGGTVHNKPFHFICSFCGTQVELPAALLGKKYICKACGEESVVEVATEKPCPFCGKLIKLEARMCRFCKRDLGNAEWGVTDADARKIRGLVKWWVISLIAPFLIFLAIVVTPNSITEVLLPPMLIGAFVFATVSPFVLLYKFWRLVPANEAETTPGKAVGLLFIPFFNIYWTYVAFCKLSKHYDEFDEMGQMSTSALALFAFVSGFIPVVCVLSPILWIVWFFRMKNHVVNDLPRIG